MATVLRNTDPLCGIVATAVNALKAQVGAGANFHLDASEMTVTAANGSGVLATSITLVNQCLAVFKFHKLDTVGGKAVDTTALTAVSSTDLASAITCMNLLKTGWATHIASTAFNYNADATNTVLAANATDQASLDTLANQFKASINAHMASAPAAASIRLVDA